MKAVWTALAELNYFPWKSYPYFEKKNGNLLEQGPGSRVDVLDIPIGGLLIW